MNGFINVSVEIMVSEKDTFFSTESL